VIVVGSLFFSGGILGDIYTQFIGSVMCPCAYVIAGSRTAPSYRFVTSIVLTLLLTVGETIIATLVIVQKRQTGMSIFWLIVCGIAGLVGAIVVCLEMRKQEENEAAALAASVTNIETSDSTEDVS
jgi:hypothetical protein